MLATDLAVGCAYAQRVKPNDADCPLRKIIFVDPLRRAKPRSVTLMAILMAWRSGSLHAQ